MVIIFLMITYQNFNRHYKIFYKAKVTSYFTIFIMYLRPEITHSTIFTMYLRPEITAYIATNYKVSNENQSTNIKGASK